MRGDAYSKGEDLEGVRTEDNRGLGDSKRFKIEREQEDKQN